MKKIPTLLKRDPDNMRSVLMEVNPGCEWVLAGEGVATRKYDGTCMMLDDDGQWWRRREVKPDKEDPENFQLVQTDEVTGKRVGWVPMDPQGFLHPFLEALDYWDNPITSWKPGTYELVGPMINKNPEKQTHHRLIPHGADVIERREDAGPLTIDMIKDFVLTHANAFGWEGIVWHHPDGRMAKLKKRDLV